MADKMQTWFLLAIGGLGGLLYGIDFGVIAVSMPYIKALKIYTDAEVSWIVGAVMFGGILASATAGVLCDRLGRKRMIAIAAALFLAAILVTALLEIVMSEYPFVNFGTLVYPAILECWTLTVSRRIKAPAFRRAMAGGTVSIAVLFLLRLFRYALTPYETDLERWLWYAYYLPLGALPVFFYLAGRSLYEEDPERRGKDAKGRAVRWSLLIMWGALSSRIRFSSAISSFSSSIWEAASASSAFMRSMTLWSSVQRTSPPCTGALRYTRPDPSRSLSEDR